MRTPLIQVALSLPQNVVEAIDEHARSQYLSRSAVVRQIVISEIEKRHAVHKSVEAQEVAA